MRALSAIAFLVACSDYDVKDIGDPNRAGPRIELSPARIDFGGLAPGDSATEVLTVSSVGSEPLVLGGFRVENSLAFTIAATEERDTLAPGDSLDLLVTYTPTNVVDEGLGVVLSNDPAEPEALAQLIGGGLWPRVAFDPIELDFGLQDLGATVVETLDIVNAGGAPLVITSGLVIGEGFSAAPVAGVTLQPGERHPVEVTFAPTFDAAYTGALVVQSNAPTGTDQAPLRGTTLEEPIAVCSVDPPEAFALYDDVTWFGSSSYDPSGYAIVDYEWSLIEKPMGSAASLPPGDADLFNFRADVVGTYRAQLVVTNEFGTQSAPCIAVLEAVPSQDLWVEMFWVSPGDDMDLHLLGPGGALWSNDDCNWQNCTGRGTERGLDWGTLGETADDPSLDIDDIPGTGPENINIFSPEEDGIYTVYVHDYPGSVFSADNDVTINIYLSGVLAWSETRTITGEDTMNGYAVIDWATKSVSGM
jgi:hypothetical protein